MMLLFILIPIAWLSVLALLVAISRTASDGDRPGADEQQSSVAIGPKLVLSAGSSKAPRPRRPTHAQRPRPASERIRRSRVDHVHH
jgi:hypothetical protein